MDKYQIAGIKERIESEFWIDPEGKIHKWKGSLKGSDEYMSLHYGIVAMIFKNLEHPDDYCTKLGWMKIGSPAKCISQAPTQAQLNTLDKLGYERLVQRLIEEYAINN